VIHDDFSDAILILVGHGSTRNVESAEPVYQHAAELRRRKLFADVREAFWKQEPRVVEVIKSAASPRVFIAPLFVSEGYFSEEVIPRALGFSLTADRRSRVRSDASRTFYYCRAIGTHDSMTSVLLSRARDVIERFPFPRAPRTSDITLFIAGHGTEQNENSRKAIDRQVEIIRNLKQYAGVHAIFMEEAPRIPECFQLAQTRFLVIVPFFISDGMHTQEDIPMLLGEPERSVRERLAAKQSTWRNPTERHGKLIWYTPAVGTESHLADVILEQVREISRSTTNYE
jgi:sirohydrochlorin cobaltochelatase